VTYNVITRIKAVLINALIGLLITVICSPKKDVLAKFKLKKQCYELESRDWFLYGSALRGWDRAGLG
jgi:hypothetical protein